MQYCFTVNVIHTVLNVSVAMGWNIFVVGAEIAATNGPRKC